MRSDSVGGAAPVISTAMFNLQSDQSRGTPRKRARASGARHRAGSLISFRFPSRSAETWGEERHGGGRVCSRKGSIRRQRRSQSCAQTPSSAHAAVSFIPNRFNRPVCHPVSIFTALHLGGATLYTCDLRNTRRQHRLCAFAMTRTRKHRRSFTGAVEQTVCVQTPDGQFPARPGWFRHHESCTLNQAGCIFAKCF